MAVFDQRLIDPNQNELAGVLGKAMKSANRENRHYDNRMSRDAAFWGRFAQDVLRSGPEGRRRSCKGGRSVPEVVAGWWTDPAGRKHIRVIGRTRWTYSRLRGEVEMRSLPPWWHVYPEAVLGVRRKKDSERYLAVCRCGAVGTPESLGWMGNTCGPCFDRHVEGGVLTGGHGQFGGWSTHLSRFAFTADGRYLIGQNQSNAFWRVSREDGTATVSKRKSFNPISATGADDAGIMLVLQDGSVYRWQTDAPELTQLIPTRQFWGRVAITANGSRVVLIGYQNAHTADLTATKPKYAPLTALDGFSAIQFTPDGSRVLGVNYAGELQAIHPTTGHSEVVRSDVFTGLPSGYGPPSDLVLSRDGTGALLRRDRYYPQRVSVRHVPLPTGKVLELNVPDWHRPTSLAYSPDGQYAVTAEADGGWVGFFEIASGRLLGFVRAVLEDTAWRSGHIEFSPDAQVMAVSYNTGYNAHGSTVAVWPWPGVLEASRMG